MSTKRDKFLVAAVDIGTTYSGYAFSLRNEFNKNPTKVSTNPGWNGGMGLSLKTPTCVLCDPRREFHSFGYEAEDKYAWLAEDNEHHKWYFFRRFKMVLYEKQIKRTIEVEDDKGLKMPARKVFGMAIGYLKKHLLDTLVKRGIGLKADEIHWILTVPAIWTKSAKLFMREAAEEAGIDGGDLTIAMEPEAAAMYCQWRSSYLSSMSRFDYNKYMVIDLGDTVCFTVHEKQADGTINEVLTARGGPWGGTSVNEQFNNMIIKIIGAPAFKQFCDENKYDHLDMMKSFEFGKRSYCSDTIDKISLRVPYVLEELYERKNGGTIKDAIEQTPYRGKINLSTGKMRLDAELFRGLFHQSISEITQRLANLLATPGAKGISTLLMVGGFSECRLVQEAITKSFPKAKVVVPDDAELAVLKGAVILGHILDISRMTAD